MPAKRVHLVFSLMFFLTAALSAQQIGRIESMKLLTPDTGWVATHNQLFWTTDNGATWKDITPKLNHKRQTVSSVFFLDSSMGWAVMGCGDQPFGEAPAGDDTCFEVASTTNSGQSWSIFRPGIIDPDPAAGFSSGTGIAFADALHGWVMLKVNRSAAFSFGVMLRTEDGGRTWRTTPQPPIAGELKFVSGKDGWLAGGAGKALYVTRDAGNSWQEVLVAKPEGVGPDTGVEYSAPTFENPGRGFLTVRYSVGPLMGPDLSTLALFATDDGGKTWRLARVMARVPNVYSSDLVGSVLIAAHSEGVKETRNTAESTNPMTKISLNAIGSGLRSSNTSQVLSQGAATQLSFVSAEQGWANFGDRLFATQDAGEGWTDVTPGNRPPLAPPPAKVSGGKELPGKGAANGSPQNPAGTNGVSSALGFDAYNVPTMQEMSTWMYSSPFYNIHIYLPNAPNGHKDPILGTSNGPGWVSAVEGGMLQGWGIVPIWVGLQSACIVGGGNVAKISNVPATAKMQGGQQADNAVANDKVLGITSGIIYLDLENYTTGGACSAAAQAYVGAFIAEIAKYPGYSAGVYANYPPIKADISTLNPLPAAIWVAWANNQVTIWNQGFSDDFWPNGQRMHQFLTNTNVNNAPNVTWGKVALSVDEDIDDGPVVNANAVVKAYTYGSPTTINCPGAINTFPIGINDMNNGILINAPGQMGAVVGSVQYAVGNPTYGFENVSGTCTTFTFPGSVVTQATAINNLGQIVGTFEDSQGSTQGFLQNPGASPMQISYTGGGQTYLRGINDAGQIVGYASSPATFGYQTFMYYNGQFYELTYGNSFIYNLGLGINGDAMITGFDYYEPYTEGFELSALPSTIQPYWSGTAGTIAPGNILNAVPQGMNANNEYAGIQSFSTNVQ